VARLAVLNPLVIKSIKEWLPMNSTNTMWDLSVNGIIKFVKVAANKANIVKTGNIRFHRIHAWTFNSLLKAGFSELEAKYIIGKQVPQSDATYLRLREGIEAKYLKVYEEHLNIKPDRVSPIAEGVVKQQANEIDEMKKELEGLRQLVMTLKNAPLTAVQEKVSDAPKPVLVVDEETVRKLDETK
jgi:hypothetical protein